MLNVQSPKGLLFQQYSFKGILCIYFCTLVKNNVQLLKKIWLTEIYEWTQMKEDNSRACVGHYTLCIMLQSNPAHQSVACSTLKESKWSKWQNSTFINNWTLLLLFLLVHDYYILHILTCMDVSLKNVYTVSLTYTPYHLRSEKQTIPLR